MAGGNKIVGITLEIEGKSDSLTKSLQEVQKESNQTSTALKSIDNALKEVTDDGQRVELLSQKQELLTKQIEQTSEKLEIMKQVAEDAKKGLEDGTVTKEQYAILTAEIAKTEQTLESLGNQASDTAGELSSIESGELENVGEDAETAEEGLEEVSNQAEETNVSFDALGKGAAAVGGAMVAAAGAMVGALKEVGSALVDCTVGAGDYVDEINTLSQKTGVSAETLQEWNYVSGLIDVSTETLTGSLTKLEKSMGAAADKQFQYDTGLADLNRSLKEGTISQDEYEASLEELSEKTSTAYDQLGVSIYDSNHNLRDNEEVMFEVLDALSQMPEGVERDLLSMELLGKSAKELGPLLQEGAIDQFKALSEEAHETGFVLDSETMDSFQNFDDQMERFSKSGQAAKNALGTILLPALTELSGTGTNALQKFTKAVQESNGDVSVIGNAISEMLPEVLGSVNAVLPDILSLVGTAVDSLLQILIDNLPLFVDTAISIIEQLTTTLINPENIAKVMDAAVTIVLSLTQFLLENMDSIISSAIQIVLAIVNGISSALPELIPAAVDAILTICETLLSPENLALILDAALQLVIGLTTGIINALPQLIERLPEIISGIVDFLLSPDGIGKLVSTGFDLFVAIVSDMPNIITEVVGAVAGLIGDIVSKIVEKGGEVFNEIKNMFPSFDDVKKWGGDIISGIIDGITGMLSDLWDTLTDVAEGIADFLGFSVPEKGPLHEWAAHNPGADMIELWSDGVEAALPDLESTLYDAASMVQDTMNNEIDVNGGALEQTMNVIAGGSSNDYSGTLGQISGSLSDIAGAERTIIVPVYIGQDRLETAVAKATTSQTFLSGGH